MTSLANPAAPDESNSSPRNRTLVNHNCSDTNKMRGKLLVIDDQANITKVIGLVASQIGLEVKTVNDPLQALDAFISFQPDIVILDMIMPELDGVDVLNEMLLTGIKARIILTSGFSESYLRLAEGVARFHDSGRVSILKKPFRRDELISQLEQFLLPC